MVFVKSEKRGRQPCEAQSFQFMQPYLFAFFGTASELIILAGNNQPVSATEPSDRTHIVDVPPRAPPGPPRLAPSLPTRACLRHA
eukprot:scaffold13223_cov61-Phaeocystis_antarctica.AAC.1